MKIGIVGLPNVGKSTLFNAITQAGAEVANYAFCTIDPNVGIVQVPDKRLDALAEMYNPKKYTPATIEFVDIAGLVRGASTGEGLGNRFLANIREVDAILHVVRCFEDENIVHVDGKVDPVRDMETINLELILSDLEYVDKRIEKLERLAKGGDKKLKAEIEYLKALSAHLAAEKPARGFAGDTEPEWQAQLFLLTTKPVLYVANVAESDILAEIDAVTEMRRAAEVENAEAVIVSAAIEADIASLDPEEREVFLEDLGLEESGLNRIIKAGYKLLGLISYLTAGADEVRAWTITAGTKAPQAAGKIHSDFERGFIRAEVVAFDDLMACKTMVAAKEKGLVRSEGKEYVMKDGDVCLFRFNV